MKSNRITAVLQLRPVIFGTKDSNV